MQTYSAARDQNQETLRRTVVGARLAAGVTRPQTPAETVAPGRVH